MEPPIELPPFDMKLDPTGGADRLGFNDDPTYAQTDAIGRALEIGVHFRD